MNYHYCQTCFKKTPQTIDIIKFCAHCGKSFGEEERPPHPSPHKVVSQVNSFIPRHKQTLRDKFRERLNNQRAELTITDNEDDDSDDSTIVDNDDNDNFDKVIKVPDLHGQQLEVDIGQEYVVPICSLAQGIKRQSKIEHTNSQKTQLNKKQFWAQYQKEASSIRKK